MFPFPFLVFCRSHTGQSFPTRESQEEHCGHRMGPFPFPTSHTLPLPTKTTCHCGGNSVCASPGCLLYLTILGGSGSSLWWGGTRPRGCSHSAQRSPGRRCRPVATKNRRTTQRRCGSWELRGETSYGQPSLTKQPQISPESLG